MLKNNRSFYLWCALMGGIALVTILSSNSTAYQSVAEYDSSRWLHFLAYTLVIAVPIAAWKLRSTILLSFIPPIVCIALEWRHAYIQGTLPHPQNLPADLFGLAAGILLGLNLRIMRNSTQPLDAESSHPDTY